MKIQKLLLPAVLFFAASVVSAQDYAFKVLANKGTNEVKSGDSWLPLKTGSILRSADEVKLGDNAYVGLVHSSGKPVEVKESGVHKVSDLEAKVKTGSSVLNKYTDFLLSSNSSEAKNRLSATGAVHRAIETAAIKLYLPENQSAGVFSNKAIITWDRSNVPGPYVITLKNMFEDVLAKDETAKNSYEVDLSDEKYANENAILIEVTSKADPSLKSSQHLIKKLGASDQEKVATALKELNGQVSEETALNRMILGGFYEENHLLIDAITAYQEAIRLAPDVPTFRESYEEFLVRNNLK
jgi:hypothetical protein